MHLQSRLDTNFNKDTHRTVLYFLVYDQDKEKQKDFKNVMSFRGKIVSTCQLYKPLAKPEDQRSCKRSPEICYINQIFIKKNCPLWCPTNQSK